jgi:putative phosphoribosyl transferase
MILKNRAEAGKKLAEKLINYREGDNLSILAVLPNGVEVGRQISLALGYPLKGIIVEKIVLPRVPALAVGAVGSVGRPVVEERLVKKFEVKKESLQAEISKLKLKVKNQSKAYKNIGAIAAEDGTVLIIDDGIATGFTMGAAIKMVRQSNPKKIVAVAPVIAKEVLAKIESLADEVVYLTSPALFISLSEFYSEFPKVTEKKIKELLA